MASLTPEQLAALAQQFQTRKPEASYGGYNYIPKWQTQYSGQDTQLDPTISGYRRYAPGTGDMAGKIDGLTYEDIDASGNVTGTGTFSGIDGGSLWDYGPFLMLAAGMAPALLGAGGAGAGAGAAGEAMGASGAAMGDAGLMYAGESAATAGSLGGGYMGGAGGVGAAGAAGAGAAGAGAGGAGAAAGGGLSSLLPAGASSLLGPAATVLGAVAGSQGTPGQTSERKMDPRLDQFVYGDLMPKVQGLLASQMPNAQRYGQQMQTIGSGLLSAPIAGNGFERFTKGRY